LLLILFFASLIALASPDPAASPGGRRVAVVLPEGWALPELERWASFAKRQGIEVRLGAPPEPAEGWEIVRLASPPILEDFRRRLAPFPVIAERAGFTFDGRGYRAAGDAVVLSNPGRPLETLVLGNSREAATRMLRRVLRSEGGATGQFRAVSGELTKEGRFRSTRGGVLEIDRSSEKDRIAGRERFFSGLATAARGTAVWRFPESERKAFEKWSPVLERFLAAAPVRSPATVRLYPDPATKALYMGSSRPADLSWEGDRARVDVDASAPAEPDLVSPVLASAAAGGAEPRLRNRATLLLATGARAHGRWWARDVSSFASFLEAVGSHPTVADVLAGEENADVSPIASVGAAAAWLEAGVRSGGDAALARALGSPERELAATLELWRRASLDRKESLPRRRPLPAGFLRGVSYAMSNSVEGSYASPQSLETLRGLSRMAVSSISVIPYAFSETERAADIRFVHRSPRGETDESTVRAVSDARALGMTAMVKPQIWIGGGAFVGTIAMKSPADWTKWFAAYRRFVVHHAMVAEASGAALFCVGTELSGTEGHDGEWRTTIAAVRRATGAPLVYASNWAAGAPKVRFWDALDAIGTDFYDPLSTDPNAADAALVEGVRRAVRPLARLAATTGRPVVFAEAGYPPAKGAWTAPHDEDSSRPFSPEDAARSVKAVFAALEGENWWKGVYWWKAFSDGRDAGPNDRSFNFLGRPAGEAIAAGFHRLAANGSAAR
jgi:hypothetical protein